MGSSEKIILEAAEAGKKALSSLQTVRDDLVSAKTWGITDIIVGGFIATMVKQAKMREAGNHFETAKKDLAFFCCELGEVTKRCELGSETDEFNAFSDWFSDSLYVDWKAQEQINRALGNVDRAIRYVTSFQESLKRKAS